MLPHPLPELAAGLSILNVDQGKRAPNLLTEASPVQVDHLGPGTRVDILLTVRIHLVHRTMSMTKDDGLEVIAFFENLTSLSLEIQKKSSLLLQDIQSDLKARPPFGTPDKARFEEIETTEKAEP